MTKTELKPCPFCGKEAWYQHSPPMVKCSVCPARSWDCGNRAEAYEAWNARPDNSTDGAFDGVKDAMDFEYSRGHYAPTPRPAVDLDALKREVPELPEHRLARSCEINAHHNAKIWNQAIDEVKAHLSGKPEPIEGLGEALEVYASNKVGATVICNKLWQAAKRYQEMSGE